tara:strand:+ start:157628 stop:157864 length:237 start_codon:yes stop_codon:yes gene_type:complete
MKYYLVFVTGCTEPSHEAVDSHEHGLRRYCEDLISGECDEGTDCAFMLQIDDKGEPNTYAFSNSEVEEMRAQLEGDPE